MAETASRLAGDNSPTTQFTDVHDLFDLINRTTGDFPTITHREQEKRHRKFRFSRYDSARQILMITIPTELHVALHIMLYEGCRDQLVRHGRQKTWTTMGAATRRAQGHPGGDSAEGDSTGGPMPERGGKGAWPTLVIEVGDSQSMAGLRRDSMRWWFSTSDHQVKIVLLAKFERTRGAIILEKWEEESSITRPGAMMTRHAAALQSVLRQTMFVLIRHTITQNATTDPISYNVTRGALVLGFKLLFLRDPGPGEGDFVLSVQDLEEYAERVWRVL
ncbi:hypothetical protein N658DRAFT_512552 [Parathielavia hyrcaniae]|uniref:Uncharacterized protein n=1 Tax=Parathielavia hyrcaniae TaxID=113614 RepID=A0AAN6QAW7_9PEZI|nr:hypothetical protein N658DRAFT_512552 [Parathielavia hyrcaniae]